MILLRAWITHESAQALFRRAGLDYDALKLAANRRGFKGMTIGQLDGLRDDAFDSVAHHDAQCRRHRRGSHAS